MKNQVIKLTGCNDGKVKIMEVKASKIFQVYGFWFGVHRPYGAPNSKCYNVTELSTGCKMQVENYSTISKAVEETFQLVGRLGIEKINDLIENALKYIESKKVKTA